VLFRSTPGTPEWDAVDAWANNQGVFWDGDKWTNNNGVAASEINTGNVQESIDAITNEQSQDQVSTPVTPPVAVPIEQPTAVDDAPSPVFDTPTDAPSPVFDTPDPVADEEVVPPTEEVVEPPVEEVTPPEVVEPPQAPEPALSDEDKARLEDANLPEFVTGSDDLSNFFNLLSDGNKIALLDTFEANPEFINTFQGLTPEQQLLTFQAVQTFNQGSVEAAAQFTQMLQIASESADETFQQALRITENAAGTFLTDLNQDFQSTVDRIGRQIGEINDQMVDADIETQQSLIQERQRLESQLDQSQANLASRGLGISSFAGQAEIGRASCRERV